MLLYIARKTETKRAVAEAKRNGKQERTLLIKWNGANQNHQNVCLEWQQSKKSNKDIV